MLNPLMMLKVIYSSLVCPLTSFIPSSAFFHALGYDFLCSDFLILADFLFYSPLVSVARC